MFLSLFFFSLHERICSHLFNNRSAGLHSRMFTNFPCSTATHHNHAHTHAHTRTHARDGSPAALSPPCPANLGPSTPAPCILALALPHVAAKRRGACHCIALGVDVHPASSKTHQHTQFKTHPKEQTHKHEHKHTHARAPPLTHTHTHHIHIVHTNATPRTACL